MSAPLGPAQRPREFLRAQQGPQTRLLSSPAQIVIYGGQAGGGKTFGLLLDPIHDATSWSGFRGILLRKTLKAIAAQGGPWDVASRIYPRLGATARGFPHFEWTFPSGGRLSFAQIHDDGDLDAHQGAQYTWCADLDTDVLMADESYKRLGDVVVGDVVATLVGPRRVTFASSPYLKPCFRLEAAGGAIVVSGDHQILCERRWASPEGPTPIRCRGPGSTHESSRQTTGGERWRHECSCEGRSPPPALQQRHDRETQHPENAASSEDGRSGCEASDAAHQESRPPRESFDLAVLLERALHPEARGSVHGSRRHALSCAHSTTTESRGSQCGCRAAGGSCDGPPRSEAGADPSSTPSPGDAAEHSCGCSCLGGLGSTQSHSRRGRIEYFHPYTKEPEASLEAVRLAPVSRAQVGERAVRDLRVEGAAHWIARGGFVSRNCGFDEGTHFTAKQFWYLVGRMRSPFGKPPPGTLLRTRLTCNPDPRSFVAKLIAWWIDQKTGLPIPEHDGAIRYIARDGDTMFQGSSPREVREQAPHLFVGVDGKDLHWRNVCLTLTFIKSTLADNAALMSSDPAYQARLRALDPVTRRQWMDGNWLTVSSGEYFRGEQFLRLTVAPPCTRVVRFWDLAGSKRRRSDYLAGVKQGIMEDGTSIVLDVVNLKGSPAEHEATIKATAERDGRDVEIWIEEEKGASGQLLVDNWSRHLLRGYFVQGSPNGNEDKQARAKLPSAAVANGQVRLLEREWTDTFVTQHEAFPDGDHDDIVDGFTGSWHRLYGESGFAFASIST